MLNSEAVADPTSASTGRIAPFGKYLLLQRVSVGGMAEVFKALPAHADRIDQIVAIKRILPNIAEDEEFIGMFIDEARIAGQLTHPNICRIYELGRVHNDHYIAMQFLWGRDLLKLMNRYKKAGRFVDPVMAAYIGSKALSALHYAHNKCDEHGEPLHIIHRDVSPQNIIVGYSGQVKLIDFGVARAASQSQKTQAGILKGKFGYMSPEMIRGLPIDHRSDVFAMGICLHELLTSARLFYGETDFATLELVRDARVVPPSHKAAGVPPALDAIVMKALAREADDRFQSAEEMQHALEHFLATHDPEYGQSDVGLAMRQAFHTEVERERARLELFWGMLERGELVRGAAVPTLVPGSVESEERPASPVGALLEASEGPELSPAEAPLDGGEAADESDELQDEQTHIFFSASERDELRELEPESEQQPERRRPTITDMVPPAPAHGDAFGAPSFMPSGTYQRTHAEPTGSLFDQPYERPSRPASLPAPEPLYPQRPRHRNVVRYGVLALLLLTLGLATYAVPKFASAGTGSLEIEGVGERDALVRVDGVVRGNPPLVVEGLSPGVHQIEIEAKGFEIARADVHVERGQARPVKLTLLAKVAQPDIAALPGTGAPAVPVEPQITSLAPPKQHSRERPKAPRSSTRATDTDEASQPDQRTAGATAWRQGAEDAPSPTVQGAAPSETQVAESFNEEMAAAGEGELLISTVPWSHVFVDDEDTGRDTPVRSLRVPEGRHRIGLRTPDDVMHQVEVDVVAGQVVRIIRRF